MTTRFLIELSSKPGTDLIRALRRGLKYLGRACGLRAIRVTELPPPSQVATPSPKLRRTP